MRIKCIYGTGGFGKEVYYNLIDISKATNSSIDKIVFMVDDEYYVEDKILGVEVLKFSQFNSTDYEVVVAIANPLIRNNIVSKLPDSTIFYKIIHPSVLMSETVNVGEGCILTAGVKLTCNINIGAHAHLNINSVVAHDCVIGNYFTTAPGVFISGNCKIGNNVYIGTNSAIKEDILICDNVNIGMNSAVTKNITESGSYISRSISLIKI
jgi:sugar O-acyltransferase (sialic acid O-acetyltransferase NeuD family)